MKSIKKKLLRQSWIYYSYMKTKYYIIFIINSLKEFIKILIKPNRFFSKPTGREKKIPKVIQLPITNRCNLRCKTCNVKSVKTPDFNLEDLKKAFNNKLFSEIEYVGINGGEPFLKKNIIEYVKTILTLPKIKAISIISNGVFTDIITNKLQIIYKICKEHNVRLNFTMSLDGPEKIHDYIRGLNGAFKNTITTYKTIKKNQKNFCDHLGIITTISVYNIPFIKDYMAFCEVNNIENVNYQLAVPHGRLYNKSDLKFSVMEDEYSKMLATEFFFELFVTTKRKRYYFIYKYLKDKKKQRMSYCNYQDRDITIDAEGYIRYCATASKALGHITENNLFDIFFDKANLDYRAHLVATKCDNCIHYSNNNGFFKYSIMFHKELLHKTIWSYFY